MRYGPFIKSSSKSYSIKYENEMACSDEQAIFVDSPDLDHSGFESTALSFSVSPFNLFSFNLK